jgi:hypothetical protein
MTKITIYCSHPHFAPSVEHVRFSWAPPPGRKIDRAIIEITDRSGTRVRRHELTAPPLHGFDWDGEDTEAAPVMGPAGAIKQYVDPLRSPFTATFTVTHSDAAAPLQPPPDIATDENPHVMQCRPAPRPLPPRPKVVVTATSMVRVLYREIRLRAMTWSEAYRAISEQPDDAFPAGASDDIKTLWLQYRLNELGYPAGALDDPPHGSPILRALFRYTQSHPDLPHFHAYETLGPWGWEDAFEAEFGDIDDVIAGVKPSGALLLAALTRRDNPRRGVVETTAALEDRTQSSRIILDHDLYYINKDFATPDAHAEYDAQLLNPITLPFVAEARLVSRDDRDATRPGVAAPAAVGAVPLEWTIFDPPEDASVVPTPTSANVPLRSQARRYLRHVQEAIARSPDDTRDAQDNCPATHGGALPSAYRDMTKYFAAMDKVATSRSPDGRHVFTAASRAIGKSHVGQTGVFFTGSYIAGDNYVVQARLSFDGVPNGPAIQSDHTALAGLKDSFVAAARWMQGDTIDPVVGQSGVLTIWRRHHVARELLWGPSTLPPIQWFPIIDSFRAAHIVLVPPRDPPIQIAALFDNATRAAIAAALVDGAEAGDTKDEFVARRGAATVRTDGMYPLPLRTLVDFEASPRHSGAVATTPSERFAKYSAYLTAQGQDWPSYASLVDVSLAIRKALDTVKSGPGVVVIRAQYMPDPDWAALLPPNVLQASSAARARFRFTKAIATGMDYGVVFLDSINGKKYADIFFVTHEISHCLFGSHAFENSSFDDHDRSDANCIMFYSSHNGGLTHGWAVRNAPATYRARLELRRAAGPTVQVDSYGRVEGSFTAVNPKTYEFEGDATALQKAVRGLSFKPARDLPQDLVVEIGLSVNDVNPVTSPERLPITRKHPVANGTVTPFAQLSFSPVDLRACQPRFCGKCLLKLRGWRVRELPPAARNQGGQRLPERSPVVPVNPRMEFVGYFIQSGGYLSDASGASVFVELFEGATDPLDSSIALGPYAFLHRHRLTWESSNGRMQSLAGVLTREWVKFRSPTQALPFSSFADPDQEFTQEGDNGDFGCAQDDHSVGWPALIVASQLRAGTLIGEQWYQYSFDGTEWFNIEGAAFLLEKSVRFAGGRWLLRFKKTNWAPHNPTPFEFSIDYVIGGAPRSAPKIVNNPTIATPAAPHRTGGSVILQSGATSAMRTRGKTVPTTLGELRRKGYVPP